ncbi:unnamed protein product [Dicrocoelium dendriticum]|nr:unnamed protein product [Dicrocoelium dendriticum]
MMEEIRHNTQQHTAFMITQHEIVVSKLNEKIEKLETDLCELNRLIQEKDDELERLKLEFSETVTERDLQIDRLKQQLSTQGLAQEGNLMNAFDSLVKALGDDYKQMHRNFTPWSQKSLQTIELEFLNPPYLDEESTEYYADTVED